MGDKKKRRSRSRSKNWAQRNSKYVGLAVIAAVSLGLVVTVLTQPEPTPAQPLANVTPSPAATAEPLTVAFLGDSYTAPEGTIPTDNYVGFISRMRGWDAVPFGQGGTGYTNPGQAAQNESVYLERVPAVIAAEPDIVFVQGGTNDQWESHLTEDAATAAFTAIKAGLPEATIIAVGPVLAPGADPAATDRARTAIRAAADGHSIPFIDPTAEGWLQGSPELFLDGFHLNRDGNIQYAKLLNASARQIIPD